MGQTASWKWAAPGAFLRHSPPFLSLPSQRGRNAPQVSQVGFGGGVTVQNSVPIPNRLLMSPSKETSGTRRQGSRQQRESRMRGGIRHEPDRTSRNRRGHSKMMFLFGAFGASFPIRRGKVTAAGAGMQAKKVEKIC